MQTGFAGRILRDFQHISGYVAYLAEKKVLTQIFLQIEIFKEFTNICDRSTVLILIIPVSCTSCHFLE